MQFPCEREGVLTLCLIWCAAVLATYFCALPSPFSFFPQFEKARGRRQSRGFKV